MVGKTVKAAPSKKTLAAVNKAIDLMGGAANAARELSRLSGDQSITEFAIARWKTNGIPAHWIVQVHRMTEVPLHDLDPKIYPRDLFARGE